MHACDSHLYSVFKRHVQFCLIASLIARVHGKYVFSRKASGSCNQSHYLGIETL